MAITSIARDFQPEPAIIRMSATDNLSVITTVNYWTTQADVIQQLNKGAFTIDNGEVVLAQYGDGQGFLEFDSTNQTFAALPNSGNVTNSLPSGQVFVGNGSNVVQARALTGAIAITNTGVTSINAGAVSAADLAANAVGSDQLEKDILQLISVNVTAAQFKAMYGAPLQVIAAPGANKLILVEHANLLMTYVTTPYAAGGSVALQYDSTVHGGGQAASATIANTDLQASASVAEMVDGKLSNSAFTACVDKALYISNISAAFTTGDSTFVLNIWYRIVATA